MGQKDLNFKSHIEDNACFADLFNGILFHGEEVIKADELEEADQEIIVRINEQKMANVIPDKVRKWKGRNVAILVVEHQSYVDYRMVLRAMLMEAYGYLKQFAELVAKQKDSDIKLQSDEFLSKVQKEHRFEPIILIVVYLGTKKEWDAQTCLHDILDIDNTLKPYVSNYRLNIFDYHDYSDFTVFKTANRVLFEALANAGDNKAFHKAMENCDIYRRLSRETALAIQQLTGMTFDLETIKCIDKNGKEVYDMCKAFEDERMIGREEGICSAITMCKNMGIAMQNVIENIAIAFSLSKEIAEQKVSMYW